MNFTDVDDKTIAASQQAGVSLREYTDRYIAAFREDAAAMGLEPVEENPRATDEANLRAMVEMITALEARGHTYRVRRIDLLPDRDAAGLRQAGAARSRGHPGRRARRRRYLRQAGRARLRAVEGDQAGRADVGLRLRPGPARLAHRVLGDGAAAAGRAADRHPRRRHRPRSFRTTRTRSRRPKARPASRSSRFWVHVEFLNLDNEKMSKSLGNVFTVRDILDKGYRASALRYLLISVHYRKQLTFNWDVLDAGRGGADAAGGFPRAARRRHAAATAHAGDRGARRRRRAPTFRDAIAERPQRARRARRRCSSSCAR